MEANEWATPTVYLALAIGLVMIAYAGYKALFGRNQSFLQPDIACMIFMWCSYHLSPIIALGADKNWRAFMLSNEYIEHALWMSLASVFAFTIGFRCLMTAEERNLHAVQSWSERASRILSRGSLIKNWYLWVCAALVVIVFIIVSGGINEIWEASYTRGEGSWMEQTLEVRITRFLAVILPLMSLALIALAAIYSTSGERSLFKVLTIGSSFLAASLSPMHGFSRSSGVAFFCFAIIRFVLLGRRDWKVFCGSIAFGFWLSYVGYNFRGEYRPGLGNFLEAAGRSILEPPDSTTSKGDEDFIVPDDNFLSAIEAYTAVVAYVEQEEVMPFSDLLEFIYNLHPFPSGFVGMATRGVDLTDRFGMRGQVGLTTPTMGDIFVSFGYATPIFYLGLGLLYHFIQNHARRFGPSVETVLLLLLFLGWPLSGHSAFRAQWRMINLVLITLFCLYLLKRRGYFSNIETARNVQVVRVPKAFGRTVFTEPKRLRNK